MEVLHGNVRCLDGESSDLLFWGFIFFSCMYILKVSKVVTAHTTSQMALCVNYPSL